MNETYNYFIITWNSPNSSVHFAHAERNVQILTWRLIVMCTVTK